MKNRGAVLAIEAINNHWEELKDKLNRDAREILEDECRYGYDYWYDQEAESIFVILHVGNGAAAVRMTDDSVYLGSLDFDADMLDLYNPEDPEEVENIWMNYEPAETLGNWLDYWEDEVKREW